MFLKYKLRLYTVPSPCRTIRCLFSYGILCSPILQASVTTHARVRNSNGYIRVILDIYVFSCGHKVHAVLRRIDVKKSLQYDASSRAELSAPCCCQHMLLFACKFRAAEIYYGNL